MKAATYCRVSTEEQAQEGFSIPSQGKINDAYCVVKGYDEIVRYVDEGFSAKNLKRPEVQRLIADCQTAGFEAVVVWRLDRLSRSLRDTLELYEDIFRANGIALISVSENIDTSTPAGRLMLNILASFAQNEREVTEERVRMVSVELAKECRHLGGLPPFGYRIEDKQYYIDPLQASAVRAIFEMYTDGIGYNAILRYLNDNGFRTARGNAFHKPSLYELLGNEKYVGTYIYNRTVSATKQGRRNNHASKPDGEIVRIPDGIPAIIDEVTWRRACERRLNNKRHTAAYKARQVYLLSGVCVCGVCGAPINGASMGKDRNGTIQRYYHCKHKDVKRIRKEKLEAFVLKFLQLIAQDETMVAQAVEAANSLTDDSEGIQNAECEEIRLQIVDVEKKINNISDFIAENGISAPVSFMDTVKQLEKKKDALQTALEASQRRFHRVSAQDIIERLQAVVGIENSPPEQQKIAVQRAVPRLVLYDDRFCIGVDNALYGGGEGS